MTGDMITGLDCSGEDDDNENDDENDNADDEDGDIYCWWLGPAETACQ